MNDKLILRAAVKYRDWLIDQSEKPVQIAEENVLRDVQSMLRNADQVSTWVSRFFRGAQRRSQFNSWEPDIEHIGILSTDVYKKIARNMIPDLSHSVLFKTQDIISQMKSIVDNKQVIIPPLRDVVDEIKAINQTWKEVVFTSDLLSVLTEEITLSDDNGEIYLGHFWIRLNLFNPVHGLKIDPVDAVMSPKEYYHPHVSTNGELCKGDGTELMQNALNQGRLEDFFTIVESILNTYNGESPYEELEEWYNPNREGQFRCQNCDEWRDDENGNWCSLCETTLCDGCIDAMFQGDGICQSCDKWHCGECTERCGGCGDAVCTNCAISCSACNTVLCKDCVTGCDICSNQFCQSCTDSCARCDNVICIDCNSLCECCGNTHCQDCIETYCNKCEKGICDECATTCEECKKVICRNCEENECEHCGCKMCETCTKNRHKCLLEGINCE